MEEQPVKMEEQSVKNEEPKKTNQATIILVIIIVLLITVIVYLLFFRKEDKPTNNNENNNGKVIDATSTPIPVTPTEEPTPVDEVTSTPKSNVTPTPKQTQSITPTPTVTDTFTYEGDNGIASYGYAIVKGYAEVKKDQKDCGVMGCEESTSISINDTVDFYIVSTESKNFKKAFIEGWYSDPDGELIRIGCVKEGKLTYTNRADEFNGVSKAFTLSEELTNKIISSSKANPITLKLEKKKMSEYTGMGNQCDSYITTIELVK